MTPALLFHLAPTGPWRVAPDSGDRDDTARLLHSDTLYSGLTLAMDGLGLLSDWLASTSGPETAVRLTSVFPRVGDLLLVTPPRTLWPPLVPPAPSTLRWSAARFVPFRLVAGLLRGEPLNASSWLVDGPSACLLPSSSGRQPGPFRTTRRTHAALDRLVPGQVVSHATVCLEFAEEAGWWLAVAFRDEAAAGEWSGPVEAALRLLGDDGVGGDRSSGCGHFEVARRAAGDLASLLLSPTPGDGPVAGYWLLSLFSPGEQDRVDWGRGDYRLVTRAGRTHGGHVKRLLRMVEEGSVLVADLPPQGRLQDVAPLGAPHPSYRNGAAVALPLPGSAG